MNQFDLSKPCRDLDKQIYWELYADKLDPAVSEHAKKYGLDSAIRYALDCFFVPGATPWTSFNGFFPPAFSSDPAAARRLLDITFPATAWTLSSDGTLVLGNEVFRGTSPELAICTAVLHHNGR